ncbi:MULTISPECIES: hypothetical protein [unclassified Bradyrhizobium]|jgi:hypothetical protein|uniref:hypothetical protein n=1 Tax=unclassified Bradyrhizobium TaxID=2631580 RepID=UPI000708DC81|nr:MULTISPECIES: hypothetical protein [unclassified Bradyrhizobium]KQT15949.1 hypothetical protein ASG57_06405 [Bradyrhizobium sp. Leaf396]
MKIKLALAAFPVFGIAVLGYAYARGYPPFASQFVQTCETAIQERLAVPSTYQRIGLDDSRRTIRWDEFFADPERAVSASTRRSMMQAARHPPVQYVALIDYQAQDSIGAIIRQRASCTFNSLDGSDAPTRTFWVKIDGERNLEWAARQPNATTLHRRLLKNL